jgi:LPXTG-motif cell wall-anchored protein
MKTFLLFSYFLLFSLLGKAQKSNPTYLYDNENMQDKIKKYLFCKVEVSKTNAYIGESIMVTYKLYSALESNSYIKDFPNFDGFSTHEMKERDVVEKVVMNNITYNCHTLKQLQIYPTASGIYTLNPIQIINRVVFKKYTNPNETTTNDNAQYRDLNGGLISSVETNYEMHTDATTIQVLALPVTDSTFGGAVGNFSLDTKQSTSYVNINEAITITYTISGSGNLHLINKINPIFPNTVEVLEPTYSGIIDYSVIPSKGAKTFTYKLLPKDSGILKITPFPFVYFNPALRKYINLLSDSITIEVSNTLKKNAVVAAVAVNSTKQIPYTNWILFALGGILIVGGFIIYFRKRKVKTNAITTELPMVEEDKPVAEYFPRTKTLLVLNEQKDALIHLRIELLQAVCKKYQLPLHTNYMQILQQVNSNSNFTTSLQSIITAIDAELYASSTSNTAAKELLEKAKLLIGGVGV